LIGIVRQLQEPSGLVEHPVAHGEFQPLALGIVAGRDDM